MNSLPDPGVPTTSVHTFEVNYHALLAGSPDSVILFDIGSGRLLDANANAQALCGLNERELLVSTVFDISPTKEMHDCIASVARGEIRVHDIDIVRRDGHRLHCEMRLVQLPAPHRHLMHARIVDVTRRHQDDQLRIGQGRLLELVARGAPLAETLDQLMHLIESQSDGVLCSVLLLDDDGKTMHPCSGPSLPPAYMAALEGHAIGPGVGSCGTAMYRKDVVIVSDIMHDPLWAPYLPLVEPFGLRACWSTPIYLDKTQVLGSFAMYYREVRTPVPDDMRLIAVATHLAGIAIERTRRERELAQHREHLEELVDARTHELTVAIQHTDLVNQELATTLDYLRMAQEELVRRDKLAALGSLVTGIAHELNTPIGNSLVLASTMADRSRSLASDMRTGLRRSTLDAHLVDMENAGDILVRNLERAAKLVSSFKQISVDHTSQQRRVFSLTQLLTEIEAPLRIGAKGRPIELLLHADPGLEMDSYPGPLAQVINNLFDNCLVHAFDDRGGVITLEAQRRSSDTITLSIADNGIGIAPLLLPRVYDPFYTTKLGSGGSGLGLHVAHNIVTGVLGGRIEAVSNVGEGTTFTLVLPVIAPDFAQAQDAAPNAHA